MIAAVISSVAFVFLQVPLLIFVVLLLTPMLMPLLILALLWAE